MDRSIFLARVLGIYYLIVSTAIAVNFNQFASDVERLINNPSLMFISSFFTLIIGLLMVVSHNIWEWSWRVLVTIIAWLALIKGVSILFLPHYFDNLSLYFVHHMKVAYMAAGIDFLLGLLLCYYGFRNELTN
jgi:hypothetical protein